MAAPDGGMAVILKRWMVKVATTVTTSSSHTSSSSLYSKQPLRVQIWKASF